MSSYHRWGDAAYMKNSEILAVKTRQALCDSIRSNPQTGCFTCRALSCLVPCHQFHFRKVEAFSLGDARDTGLN